MSKPATGLRPRTTIGIWISTIPLLDRICAVNRRTRQEQVDFFCALEAQRLGIETEVAKGSKET